MSTRKKKKKQKKKKEREIEKQKVIDQRLPHADLEENTGTDRERRCWDSTTLLLKLLRTPSTPKAEIELGLMRGVGEACFARDVRQAAGVEEELKGVEHRSCLNLLPVVCQLHDHRHE